MRTIVELPVAQIESLDVWCRREGVSRAEAVRRAVAEHLRQHHTAGAKTAFGLWRPGQKGRGDGGLRPEGGSDYQDRLRAEWEARERGWS